MKTKKHSNKISRRKFIGQSSCAAVGYTTLLSSISHLKMMGAASMNSGQGDYKALVCLLLSGGNDSYNMIIPRGLSEYNDYNIVRSNLAIPRANILSLNNGMNNNRELGFHPSMPNLRSIYNQGDLAIINNVGTLIEPTTQSQLWNNQVKVPLGLYSHSDQIKHWQSSVPQSRSANGWGGRMADILSTFNENDSLSLNMSLSGNNIFQSGNTTSEFSVEYTGEALGINSYGEPGAWGDIFTRAVDSQIDYDYQNVFKKTYAGVVKNAQQDNMKFTDAFENAPDLNTQFSNTDLSVTFQTIARIISTREDLGMSRQVFFIDFGGWDHHDEVLMTQARMLSEVDNALSEFNQAIEEQGLTDSVTTFTISDFARTLTSNGNGTDHAWGASCMVMGGAVNGGMYGAYPDLFLGNGQQAYDGVIIPTMSTDEYFAELAMWFGVTDGDLPFVLPNLGNFYSIGSGSPIGFLV